MALSELARLESGHTPSRRHPEYWGGSIPWVSIRDARAGHGKTLQTTDEQTNDLGILNSSARVLPAGTVCLSRTASVGYVTVLGQPMATSQDFVNWVCGSALEPNFLKYLLLAEGKDLLRFASGSVHQTIYFPEAKAFHVCIPERSEQQRIVAKLDEAFEGIATAEGNAEKNVQSARDLFTGYSDMAFASDRVGVTSFSLGSLARFRNGVNYTKSSKGYSIRLVGVKDFKNKFWAPQEDLDEVVLDGALNSNDTLSPGDILAVRSNGNPELIGRTLLVGDIAEPITHSGFTIRIRVEGSDALPRYVCHFLKSPKSRRTLVDGGNGASIRSLNQSTLASIMVPLPAISTQRSICASIEELEVETARLERVYRRKLAALEELEKSLLHQAFSGKL